MQSVALKDIFLKDEEQWNPEIMNGRMQEIKELMLMHHCGIKEIQTKLEILNSEFQVQQKRNPIEYMKTRVKTLESIEKKLKRKGFPVSVESAIVNLNDIAGTRVICSFVDDIYHIADMLKKQDDVTLIEEKDYIKNPKKNGYRSYHMVVEVPVFFSNATKAVRVEVQIRTIAMDFWASLEHKLYYKKNYSNYSQEIYDKLQNCAEVIAETDIQMQKIRCMVDSIE